MLRFLVVLGLIALSESKTCTGCPQLRCPSAPCPAGSKMKYYGCSGTCYLTEDGKCSGYTPKCACDDSCGSSSAQAACEKKIAKCLAAHNWNVTDNTCDKIQHNAVCAAETECLTKTIVANCKASTFLCPALDCNPSPPTGCAAVQSCLKTHSSKSNGLCAYVTSQATCYINNDCPIPANLEKSCDLFANSKKCPNPCQKLPDECFQYPNVTACNNEKGCGWSRVYGWCEQTSVACPSLTTGRACRAHTGCQWRKKKCISKSTSNCKKGYFGPQCNDEVKCNSVGGICLSGTCWGKTGSGYCSSCHPGYFGIDCSEKVTCKTANGYCSGNGCWGVDGNGYCTGCKAGWTGDNCQTKDNFKCPQIKCEHTVQCFEPPCFYSSCPSAPDAHCCNNFCGGCKADWYKGEKNITETCYNKVVRANIN